MVGPCYVISLLYDGISSFMVGSCFVMLYIYAGRVNANFVWHTGGFDVKKCVNATRDNDDKARKLTYFWVNTHFGKNVNYLRVNGKFFTFWGKVITFGSKSSL